MKRASLLLVAIGALLLHAKCEAQTAPPPKLNAVSPIGGKAGSTFEMKVAGLDIDGVETLHFNFPGVQVEALSGEKVPPPEMKKPPPKQPAPVTAFRFKVTLPPSAPIGSQDVRLVTKAGISNPRAFVVSDTRELVEDEPNDDVPKAQRIDIGSSVSGVIATPTDVDFFQFAGKRGQRLVCSVLASSVDSRLPAAVEMFSLAGVRLGSNRNYAGNDALLSVTLPEDGEYLIRLFSFSHTLGGPDCFYRMALSAAPWIDAIYPPVLEPGKETKVTVYGRNLPGGVLDPKAVADGVALEKLTVSIKAPSDPLALQRLSYTGIIAPLASMLDGFEHRLKSDNGVSNSFLLGFARAAVVLDNGDNPTQEAAQNVQVPCEIAGRIETKGSRHWYAFTAKKGQVFSIEAFAERIGSPMDLFIVLKDSKGTTITEQDDTTDVPAPFFLARTDDPARYRFNVPADGGYALMVTTRDSFTQFGPRHIYRVSIAPEQPDFRVVVMPPSPISPDAGQVGQGGGMAYTVYAWRLGGYAGDIVLAGEKLPDGVTIQPQILSNAQKLGVLVASASASAKPFAGAIHIVGSAVIKGQKTTREARGASISWPVQQAGTTTLTRIDREIVLAVRDKAPYALTLAKDKVSAVQGDSIKVAVKLKLDGDAFKTPVQVQAVGLPATLVMQPLTLAPGKEEGTAIIDGKGVVAPGNYTIVFRGQTQPVNMNKPPAKGAPPNLVQMSPPVALTVVPKQLAKLTAAPAQAKVSVGKSLEVVVRAARQFDLPIAFKVEAILPPNVKGLTIADATIPADGDEARLTIVASPQAVAGANASITIRATALFNGSVPIVHETKLQVSVSK